MNLVAAFVFGNLVRACLDHANTCCEVCHSHSERGSCFFPKQTAENHQDLCGAVAQMATGAPQGFNPRSMAQASEMNVERFFGGNRKQFLNVAC